LQKGQVHPLLGRRVEAPQPHWQAELDRRLLGYLDDHGLHGASVFPATGYMEMALAAADQIPGEGSWALEDLELKEALVVAEGSVPRLQLVVSPDQSFTISSRLGSGDGGWTTHVTGQLSRTRSAGRPVPVVLANLVSRCMREFSAEEHYRRAEARGVHYGPTFRGVEHLWMLDGEALGRVAAPPAIVHELPEYYCHPALLDACVQVALAALRRGEPGSERLAFLPVRVARIRIYERLGSRVFAHARLAKFGAGYALVDCAVCDGAGNVVASIEGIRLHPVDLGVPGAPGSADCLYELRWQPQAQSGSPTGDATCLPGPRELAEALRPQAVALASELGMSTYYEVVEPQMHAFGIACIVAAFRKLGWVPRPGEQVSVGPLMERLQVLPRHERLVHRLLAMLEAEGSAASVAGRYAPAPRKWSQVTWNAKCSPPTRLSTLK
jgi:acyl transferase domain-containing protein